MEYTKPSREALGWIRGVWVGAIVTFLCGLTHALMAGVGIFVGMMWWSSRR